MQKADDHQVGGNHYRVTGKELQHWTLVRIYQWDYFQAQVTKYVMRWKNKHATHEKRLEDLKKARHFLDKYIEDAECYDPRYENASVHAPHIDPLHPSNDVYRDMVPVQRHLDAIVNEDWAVEGYNGDGTQHYRCRHCGAQILRARTVEEASQTHGHCASGRGYTSQG